MCCDNVKPAYKPVIGCGVGILIVVLGALGISIYNIEAIRRLQDQMANKNTNTLVYYTNSNTTDSGSKPVLLSSKPLSGIVPLDTPSVATVSNNLPNVSSRPSSSVNNALLSDTNTNASASANSTYLDWALNSTNNVNNFNGTNVTFLHTNYSNNYSFDITSLNQTNLKPLQRIIHINNSIHTHGPKQEHAQKQNSTAMVDEDSDDSDEFVTVFCNGIRVSEKMLPSSNVEVEYHDDHLTITCNGKKTQLLKTKKPNTVVFRNGKKIITNKAKPNPTPSPIRPKQTVKSNPTVKAKPTILKPASRTGLLRPTSVSIVKPKPFVRVHKSKPTKAVRVVAHSSNLKQLTPTPKVVLSYTHKNKIVKLLPVLKHLTNYAREKPMINIKLIKNSSSKHDENEKLFEYDDEEEECDESFEDCDD